MGLAPASTQRMVSVPVVSILAFGLLLGSAKPAHAYIDPGSGSMMLQLLLGGVAGLVVLIKLYWRRFSDRARALFSRTSGLSE